MSLASTDLEHLKLAEEYEKKGLFNEHLDRGAEANIPYIKVSDDKFSYTPGFFKSIGYFFTRLFVVYPYNHHVNNVWFKTKVYGRKNLKGIKGGIVICNHVNRLDSIVLAKGLKKGRKLHLTAAEFNNFDFKLGRYMRAFNLMPIAMDHKGLKKFNNAFDKFMKKNDYVSFFPERAEWPFYEKPRPMENGAFHYAYKYQKPIIVTFITFRHTGILDEFGVEKRHFDIHILPPVYPNFDLGKKECIEDMKARCYHEWKECYEKTYNKKLEFLTE